jgi:hypothetical protein
VAGGRRRFDVERGDPAQLAPELARLPRDALIEIAAR